MFTGLTFVCSGSLSIPRKEFEDLIKKHKGKVSSTISKSTSYLITTEEDFNTGKNNKIVTAKNLGVYIVGESFVHDSISKKKLESVSNHELNQKKKKKKVEEKIQRIDVPEDILIYIFSFLHPLELVKVSFSSKKALKLCQNDICLDFDNDERLEKLKSKELFYKLIIKYFPNRITELHGHIEGSNEDFASLSRLKILRHVAVDEGEDTYDKLSTYCKDLEEVEFLNSFDVRVTPLFKNCTKLKSITFLSDECDIDIDAITDEDLIILSNNNEGCLEEFHVNALCDYVTENGLTSLITKCQNLKYLTLTYNYTHQDDWGTQSPFSQDFFKKLLSLPKLHNVRLNAKLKKYIKNLKNFNKVSSVDDDDEAEEEEDE